METGILAIGTAVPAYSQEQLKVASCISAKLGHNPAEARRLRMIYQATGIAKRHSILEDFTGSAAACTLFADNLQHNAPSTMQRMQIYNQHALQLAIAAVEQCLATAATPLAITHIITVSCTGMSAPGIDIGLIKHFGFPTATQRTAINFMGCYGAFSGLRAAHAICKGDPTALVLLVSVELCSLHFKEIVSNDDLIASALFADGAAAVLITAAADQNKKLNLLDFYCDIIPNTAQAMSWDIGDQGFDIGLSSAVPEHIENNIVAFTQKIFTKHQLTTADLDIFAIHPGSKKILAACEQALGFPSYKNRFSHDILSKFGNMSSATIIFILQAIIEDHARQPRESKIFSCAFGPGLVIESMLLSIS